MDTLKIFRSLVGCCLAGLGSVCAAAPIVVLVSADSPASAAAAKAFQESFASTNAQNSATVIIEMNPHGGTEVSQLRDAQVVVTVGAAAARLALAAPGDYAVVSIVIPKVKYETLQAAAEGAAHPRRTAIFLDQPLKRQLNLIQSAFPDMRRIGTVLGPTSRELLPLLRAEAQERGLSLVQRIIDDEAELFPALQAVLPDADLLLAVPDSTVLTTASARSVLVSAYRYQVPVVAFSENYVKAGAIIAVFSTPEQLGRDAAELLATAMEDGRLALPPPRYPKYFSVRVNAQVARSLGIVIADEQTLHSRLAGMHE